MLSVIPETDRIFKISGVKPALKDLSQLTAIGATIDGTFKVDVPNGWKVLTQNADSTPRFMGLFGGYSWHIHSPKAAPLMVIRPSD